MSYKIFSKHSPDPKEIRAAITDTLIDAAKTNSKIMVVDADLMSSSGFVKFQKTYPDRALNFGIMEAHMTGAAAGLSISGMMPFIHSFAPFASRRIFDQAVVSCAYANNPITIVATDPGINAAMNGGTHTTFEDVAMFRAVANTKIYEPSDSVQAEWIIKNRIAHPEGLCYIRAARRGIKQIYEAGSTFTPGVFPVVREGQDVTIFTTGILVSQAIDAAELLEKDGISVRILDAFSLSEMDIDAIVKAAKETSCLVAIDNHNVNGGLASAIADVLVEHHPAKLHRLGMTTFSQVGSLNFLLDHFGLSGEKIAQKVKSFLK
ncbi:MAG: transketolase family protein [Brevinema sp.]